jgi:signal transduction histidine kinase
MVADPFHPVVLAVIALLATPTMLSRLVSSFSAVLLALLLAVLVWASNERVRRWFNRRWPLADVPVALAGAGIGAVVSAALSVSAVSATGVFGHLLSGYAVAGFLMVVTAALCIALAIVIDARNQAVQQRLALENRTLALAVARVSGQVWAQQNRIAEILHGPVQSSLIVTAARLMGSSSSAADVEELLEPVETALARLSEPVLNPSFAEFISELREVWSGVMEISAEVSPLAMTALDAHEDTRAIVASVIRENIGNAYRSGGATSAAISVSLGESGVAIRVVNNGALEAPGAPAGLGTQLIRSSARTWSRGPVDGVQTLSGEFPLVGATPGE